MFDFGIGELVLIGIVALIVVGDDFPAMFRTAGKFTGKMRRMAREFQNAMNDAADEAGVKDVAKTFKDATSPSRMGLDKLNEAADKFDKWDPTKPSAKAKDIGSETAKLSEERAASAKKIADYTAKKSAETRAANKTVAEGAESKKAPAKKAPVKKAPAKKATAKKAPAKKAAGTKPAKTAKAKSPAPDAPPAKDAS